MKEQARGTPPVVTRPQWCEVGDCVYNLDHVVKVDFRPGLAEIHTSTGLIDKYTDEATVADLIRFFRAPVAKAA